MLNSIKVYSHKSKYAPIYDSFPEAILMFLSRDCKNLEDFGQNTACVYCSTYVSLMQDW